MKVSCFKSMQCRAAIYLLYCWGCNKHCEWYFVTK